MSLVYYIIAQNELCCLAKMCAISGITACTRPGIGRYGWQVILETSVEDLGYVALFVKTKSELTWSLNCIDTMYQN